MYSKRIRDIPGLVHRIQYRESIDRLRYFSRNRCNGHLRQSLWSLQMATDETIPKAYRVAHFEHYTYFKQQYRIGLTKIRENRLGRLILNFIPYHHVGI